MTGGVGGNDQLEDELVVPDASTAFHGGMNNHTRGAVQKMNSMRVAVYSP